MGISGVAFGDGRFVAVGVWGTILTPLTSLPGRRPPPGNPRPGPGGKRASLVGQGACWTGADAVGIPSGMAGMAAWRSPLAVGPGGATDPGPSGHLLARGPYLPPLHGPGP